MVKLEVSEFYRAVRLLQETDTFISSQSTDCYGAEEVVEPDAVVYVIELSEKLLRSLEVLSANITAIAVRNLIVLCKSQAIKYGSLRKSYEHICSRLEDELSLVHVFVVASDRVKYLEPKAPLFGTEFADKFPMAIPDMEDAGKCIAFAQGTAAVYHLMRVMEHGLRAIGAMLEIPYAPSWESYLRQIRNKCAQPRAEKIESWSELEPFFLTVESDLTAIKAVWRNPTMHVQRRFSVEEAEEIFNAVRAFMQRIAHRVPDQSDIVN